MPRKTKAAPSTASGDTDPVKADSGASVIAHDSDAPAASSVHTPPLSVEDELANLRADLSLLNRTVEDQAEQIAALRAEYCETKGHVHRIGSQPGVKLF